MVRDLLVQTLRGLRKRPLTRSGSLFHNLAEEQLVPGMFRLTEDRSFATLAPQPAAQGLTR